MDFIIRTLDFYGEPKEYSGSSFWNTCNEIFEKVKNLYTQDLLSECPKVIKDENQKERYLEKIRKLIYDLDCHTSYVNNKLISKIAKFDTNDNNYKGTISETYNSKWVGLFFNGGILDVNGKFYMTNFIETYPTDIILNYKTKNKPTAPVGPNLRDGVIEKNMIEDV